SLATAAAVSWTAKSWSQVAGANEAVRVATIGFHGRGEDHIAGMRKLAPEGVRLVALCDVDSQVLVAGLDAGRKKGETLEGYSDLRRLLDNKEIDAVTIATPNHWHSLAAIWAIQAGKDVYCEKPVSHNVWEGRKIVEAARAHKKIVQTGTQSRSSQAIKESIAWVKAGNLGKITVARGLCYKPRLSIGKVEGVQTVPDHIDYNLWCGPAPMDPLRRARLHYDWHWIWNYGCGDLGNQGIHQMDIARWYLGEQQLSARVFSLGGRFGYEDDGETPNTQIVWHDFPTAPLIFEVRGLSEKKGAKDMDKYKGGSVAVIIHCEGGYVLIPNYSSATAFDKQGMEIKKWSGATDHYENFINAVRSRKHTDLHADILEGHLSSALCHTGNISYRLGARKSPDEIREKIQSHKGAEESLGRMREHLAANEVNLGQTPPILGEFLEMDPATERFTNNREADALLIRHYRRPFVVPQQV
ncbi:MAG TPA: Gfo/Idh/MocA family oxidoreductase, partial [Verrucomicrobiae bacterium]|nr:Gfo/Idh/MocA family oxidoreductase [Verrucomicrobiae bacterium]